MKNFRKSMLTLGAAAAVGSFVAAYAPALAADADASTPAASPCGANPASPCTAKKPKHHRKHHAAKANPCAANSNPCTAKANPCAAKTNPCAPH